LAILVTSKTYMIIIANSVVPQLPAIKK